VTAGFSKSRIRSIGPAASVFGNLFAWKIAEAVEIPDYGSILTVRLDEVVSSITVDTIG